VFDREVAKLRPPLATDGANVSAAPTIAVLFARAAYILGAVSVSVVDNEHLCGRALRTKGSVVGSRFEPDDVDRALTC
jgi:hypothetical protein